MKKLFTIVLTLALVLMIAACGKEDDGKKVGKLSGDEAALLTSTHYYLKCSVPGSADVSGTLEYAVNGLKEASTHAAADTLDWALREDATIFMMNTVDKSYTTMTADDYAAQTSRTSLLPDFSGLSYSGKSGEETLDGTKYAYEEYTYSGGILRFYFTGETLSKIGMGAAPTDFLMDILMLSGDIPASLFDRSGYTSADPVSSVPAEPNPASSVPAPSSSAPAAPSSSKPAASAPASSAADTVPGAVDLSGLLGGSVTADENVQGQVTVVG
ncbi:MAG: hypothetical protein RRY21_01890 [Oscillospiraceae bacterium]